MSVLSVLGFGAVAALAVLVLMSYIQLTALSADMVSLQSQLSQLQTENVNLTAQHEQMFDLDTVKEAAEAAGMSKPSSSQIGYIDLSEGDSAVVYQQGEPNLLSQLLSSLNHGSMPWWNISIEPRTIMDQSVRSKKGPSYPCFGIAYGRGEAALAERKETVDGTTQKKKRRCPAGQSGHPGPYHVDHGAAGRGGLHSAVLKLYDLQINQHDELKAKAVNQQTDSTVISASRGTIYDTNGNVLESPPRRRPSSSRPWTSTPL